MELLDIVDYNGIPTGGIIEREEAHREGIRHRTSHLWIARFSNGNVELLLQRRSLNKDSHPGCLDISSAGHIPAGCGYVESALRELREELGITVEESELHFCGKRRRSYKKHFHGHAFLDNQVSNVYVTVRDIAAGDITYQESEICEVLWMPLDDVYSMVEKDEAALLSDGEDAPIKSCITLEEMNMLRNYINDHKEQLICEQKRNQLSKCVQNELGCGGINKTDADTDRQNGNIRLTTLCYIEQDGKILMLYRNRKKNDQSEGKWLGVGGKIESGESPEDCVRREVSEETGLKLNSVSFRGIVTFVSDIWENEFMFLYTSDEFEGMLNGSCDEGELKWVDRDKVLELPAWEGDRYFLEPLLAGNTDIHVKLIYEGSKLIDYEYV